MAVAKPKSGAVPEKETMHIAVIAKIQHGGLFNRHYHYDAKVIKIHREAGEAMDSALEATKEFAKMLTGKRIEIVSAEEVEIFDVTNHK